VTDDLNLRFDNTTRAGARSRFVVDDVPASTMPARGWRHPHNLRGKLDYTPPAHRASSRVVAGAYPFLAETGDSLRGPYIGENLLSRQPFCFDPWEAYTDNIVRSHSMALIGVKGAGKSMLAKSLATRLARMGRKVAVPHDPNGEWVRVAKFVGGRSIQVGPGTQSRINLLDAGRRPTNIPETVWVDLVSQSRRANIKAVVSILRGRTGFADIEHTAIDMAIEQAQRSRTVITPREVWEQLWEPSEEMLRQVGDGGRGIAHTLRRLTKGDLAGMFDGPSTVEFDLDVPMMVVDTSALRRAPQEAQSIARLATMNWIRQATFGANRQPRLMVHEEAAVELQNDVATGSGGLVDKVIDEKVARHDGTASLYVVHRIADFDALGDQGSALRAQALGLLSDCDTKISYAQHDADIDRSTSVLGWNRTLGKVVRGLRTGEGLWQIGPDRIAKVKNIVVDAEAHAFTTDNHGGARQP
jgi:hypothetical protein